MASSTARFNTRPFSGISVTSDSESAVGSAIIDTACSVSSSAHDIHLLALHSLYYAEKNPEFLEVLRTASLVIPDGKWLEILTRKQPFPLTQLRGEDLFLGVLDQGRESGLRHFMVGSTSAKLERLQRNLVERFAGLKIVGTYPFPFGDLTDSDAEALRGSIAESGAQVVWMGISTPRQDIEAKRISQENKVMVIAVGAAFDFVTGDKASAPKWMQKAGLEWFFRLITEPGRLWRRYIFGTFGALWRIARHYREDKRELKRLVAESSAAPSP